MLYYYDGSTINIVNEIWGIVMSVVGLLLLYIQKKRAPETKVLFLDLKNMFMCILGALIFDILGTIYDGTTHPFASFVMHISDGMVFILNSLLPTLLAIYLCHSVSKKIAMRRWISVFMAMFMVNVFMVVTNRLTHWLFWFDASNCYYRGPLFWLNHALGLIAEILAAVLVYHYRQYMNKRIRRNIFFILGFPAIALGLQLIIAGVGFLYIAETLALLVILVSLYQVNIEMMLTQQEELSESYLNSMISQIQPHFLYNVLMAIMGIEGNPPQTKSALADFGKYLRGNMDVLQSNEPISFVKELQHVKAYVDLEKLRFQEKLNVEYELNVLDFEVSALSVQMMVENAIKHGVRYKSGTGTVRIETHELPSSFVVRIIDDGVGFDTSKISDSTRSHVGISSTRERLRIMVDGELEIQSIPGKGTTVGIIIPKVDDDLMFD